MSRRRRLERGPDRPLVTARGPGDLVAAVPYLVGFTPTTSLVLVSLRGPRRRVGLVARLDLPSPGAEQPVAEVLSQMIRRDDPREVVVMVYDERLWRPRRRPWQSLVDEVERELTSHDVAMAEALYVTRERFWSYTCCTDACCPVGGRPVAQTRSSEVAAAYVLQGRSPFASRADVARRLAFDPALAVPAGPAVGGRDDTLALFGIVVRRGVLGGPSVAPDEAGRLLDGLLDVGARDAVTTRWTRWWRSLPDVGETAALAVLLGGVGGDEPVPDLDDEAVRSAVERLLVDLAVRADDARALAPLTVLAMHAWSGGDGGTAGLAVDRALRLDPGYSLAGLVDALLRSGLAPRWVASERERDEASATSPPSTGVSGTG